MRYLLSWMSSRRHPIKFGPPMLLALLAAVFAPQAARAAAGLVLIESLSGPVPGVHAFDYVATGTTIALGPTTVMVLDHLGSCVRETITGGTVHVGERISQVADPSGIARGRYNCDGTQLEEEASLSQTGVGLTRGVGESLLLHSTVPLILADQSGTVSFLRIDQPAPPINLQVVEQGKQTPIPVDMAQRQQALAAGASYHVTLGDRAINIRVDPQANDHAVALLVRLLPL
jgi:hypothetical protein